MNNFSIFDVLPLPLQQIHIVDVGARFTEEERYSGLMNRGFASLIGFEPDRSQLPVLRERYPNHIFIPAFIADGKERTFYRCHYEGCSSLYRPDPLIINQFTSLGTDEGSQFQVVSEELVQTTRLDDINEIEKCDYLKVDVQGAELDVLNGATEILSNCLVVEMEVEFIPLYENQPLFSEVDAFMRRQGFFLHRLMDISGRAFRPFSAGIDLFKPLSQLLWADAVYVRNFINFDQFEPEPLLKIAVLLHELYTSVDFCARALAHYDSKMNTSLQAIYLSAISERGIHLSFLSVKDWAE